MHSDKVHVGIVCVTMGWIRYVDISEHSTDEAKVRSGTQSAFVRLRRKDDRSRLHVRAYSSLKLLRHDLEARLEDG